MSGHNKWSTIKHKKGRADAARGKLFTKLIREIVVATRSGGKDAEGNPRLRAAIIAARGANMPKDTIERAVKRGSGELEGETYEELTYEGYGPGGVAFMIDALTSNRNRTVAEVSHAFAQRGGNLGTDGSVAWMVERRGFVGVSSEETDFDTLFEAAVEAGADDVEAGDPLHAVYCEFSDLHGVSSGLESAGFSIMEVKAVRIATNTMAVEGKDVEKTIKLMEMLDELDDVQNVYSNADISDEDLAQYMG